MKYLDSLQLQRSILCGTTASNAIRTDSTLHPSETGKLKAVKFREYGGEPAPCLTPHRKALFVTWFKLPFETVSLVRLEDAVFETFRHFTTLPWAILQTFKPNFRQLKVDRKHYFQFSFKIVKEILTAYFKMHYREGGGRE